MANFRLYYDSEVLKMKVGVNVILPESTWGTSLADRPRGYRYPVLWLQSGSGDGTWSFRKVGDLTDDRLEWHSTSPCACDFDGDGVTDLLMGAEDGFFYHLRNPRSRK